VGRAQGSWYPGRPTTNHQSPIINLKWNGGSAALRRWFDGDGCKRGETGIRHADGSRGRRSERRAGRHGGRDRREISEQPERAIAATLPGLPPDDPLHLGKRDGGRRWGFGWVLFRAALRAGRRLGLRFVTATRARLAPAATARLGKRLRWWGEGAGRAATPVERVARRFAPAGAAAARPGDSAGPRLDDREAERGRRLREHQKQQHRGPAEPTREAAGGASQGGRHRCGPSRRVHRECECKTGDRHPQERAIRFRRINRKV
jgi:hypothetical protein